MAEVACDSDSDFEVVAQSCPTPPPKRRRVLNRSAITAVPISPKKVTRRPPGHLSLCKEADCTDASDEAAASLWPPSPPTCKNNPICISLSDSEEEPEPETPRLLKEDPPLSCVPPGLKTKRANKKIRPEDVPDFNDGPSQTHDGYEDDDDILIISSEIKQKRRPGKPKRRERARKISLKIRWRMDLHKIPVLSTDPLSKAVSQLSVKLKVPPSKILLMRNDDELPVHSTITQLDLGIADIIDCLVIAGDKEDESNCDVITLRLQGKEKGSTQEYSLEKDAPLGSILSQYTSGLSAAAKRKVKFLFDGLKVKHNQTPSQLDMEDGDVIDVWG